MDEANIAILHAPLFHPAMKMLDLLERTWRENVLQYVRPMVNPSFPKNQLVGVLVWNWLVCMLICIKRQM